MRWRALALTLVVLSGCASGPETRRLLVRAPIDPVAGLEDYYALRLTPSEGGYRQGAMRFDAQSLPAFYEAQGATVNAAWAREANTFAWIGNATGLGLLAAGLCVSQLAPASDPAKNAWWVSLMPAGLLTWTFHGIGHGWFRQPSVALYNKHLAEKLGLKVVPEAETP